MRTTGDLLVLKDGRTRARILVVMEHDQNDIPPETARYIIERMRDSAFDEDGDIRSEG